VTALLDSMSYADMAAIVVAVAVTATAGTVLWLLDRCTLRVCAVWGLCLLVPLSAACAPPPELTYTRSFDTTGIEEGAAWGGFVLFTQWWEETS
jgi:hypothetical protein